MQPVNDDMDALFRRAAEDYPLNTGKADFDALLQKMQEPGEVATPPPSKEQRRNYSWLLLLLLLIPFVCRYYSDSENGNGKHSATQYNGKKNISTEAFTTQKTATTSNSQPSSSNTNNDNYQNNQPAAQQAVADSKQSVSVDEPAILSADKTLTAPANSTTAKYTLLGKRKRKLFTSTREETAADKYSNEFVNTRKQKQSSRIAKQKSAAENNINTVAIKDNEEGSSIMGSTGPEARENNAIGKQGTSTATTAEDDTAATVKNKTAPTKDSTATNAATTAAKKQEKKKLKPFIYVGLTGGIDYSAVKSKQTAGTGSNVGLVAGYSFGRHWAVETGFIRAYKKYRSEGEYVDTAGLGLAMHTQLANMHGSCTMFEIPVNVQFHFGNKARSHWYIGTGVSSYLMKKEQYDYIGKRYGMMYYSEKEYTNSTKDWFSILQFSSGYQVQMGRLGSFRAEPYVKLPLSKIGVASLSLSSAGINIGYTKPL